MFQRQGLKTKLLFMGFGFSTILFIVGLIASFGIREVVEQYNHVAEINLGNAISLMHMKDAAAGIQHEVLRLGYSGDLNSEMSIVGRNVDRYIEDYEKWDKVYQGIPFVDGEQAKYDVLAASFKALKEGVLRLKSNTKMDRKELSDNIRGDFRRLNDEFSQKIDDLIAFQDAQAKSWATNARKSADFWTVLSMTLVGLGTVLSFVVGWLFSNRVTQEIRRVLKNVTSISRDVGAASTQLSEASSQLSTSATHSASSLEESVSSIEELSSMVKLNADHSNEASSLSKSGYAQAEKGEVEVSQLLEAMSEISRSSNKIEEIINVIDDIAFQTNLLALNAAVEAARAGEQGKGFAVVAEAVRSLAQRSSAAAKDITSLIQENVEKIERGSKIAGASSEVFRNIVHSIKKVTDLNSEIASASSEQATGISQIGKAMNQLDSSTQQNAASSEEVAATSNEMARQAGDLAKLVMQLSNLIDGKSGEKSGLSVDTDATKNAIDRVLKPKRSSAMSSKGFVKTGSSSKLATVSSLKRSKGQEMIPFDDEDSVGKVGTTDGF